MQTVFLYTGEIQTGKSSTLMQWCASQNALGIITPTIDGKKLLYDIAQNKYFPYEIATFEENIIAVGRYFLQGDAFQLAYEAIENAIVAKPNWIVLDEIGKLELREEGHHRAIQLLLEKSESKLLFVVRSSLLEAVSAFYFKDIEKLHLFAQ